MVVESTHSDMADSTKYTVDCRHSSSYQTPHDDGTQILQLSRTSPDPMGLVVVWRRIEIVLQERPVGGGYGNIINYWNTRAAWNILSDYNRQVYTPQYWDTCKLSRVHEAYQLIVLFPKSVLYACIVNIDNAGRGERQARRKGRASRAAMTFLCRFIIIILLDINGLRHSDSDMFPKNRSCSRVAGWVEETSPAFSFVKYLIYLSRIIHKLYTYKVRILDRYFWKYLNVVFSILCQSICSLVCHILCMYL